MTALRSGAWTTPERARVRELFPSTPLPRLARLIGRSEAAVLRCALRMFAGPRRPGPLDAADAELFEAAVGVHDPRIIARLVRRTRAAVLAHVESRRATPPRQGRWTVAEDRLLRRRYGSRDVETLALLLCRTPDDIRHRAARLCLGQDKATLPRPEGGRRSMPRWRPDELARLRELYPHQDNVAVARALGRTVQSVASKAAKLGLGKSAGQLTATGRQNAAQRRGR